MPIFTWIGVPGTFSDWGTPTNWFGGVVPNAADADVVFPIITQTGSGAAVPYFINITATDTLTAASVSLAPYLIIYGTLNVVGTLTYTGGEVNMSGGTLRLGGLNNLNGYDVQGHGTISSTNVITNAGLILGGGLTVSVAGFRNPGTFAAASGSATLNVTGGVGSFANLTGGALTGGSIAALASGTLVLNVGETITTSAASITFSGAGATISQIVGGSTVSLQSSLTAIAGTGTLTVNGAAVYDTTNTLAVAGTIVLGGTTATSATSTARLSAAALIVGNTGRITGTGTISGPISGAGTVAVVNGSLSVGSTGTTSLEISRGTLEAQGAAGGSVTFMDTPASLLAAVAANGQTSNLGSSLLILDQPTSFTGTIAGFTTLSYVSAGRLTVRPALILVPDEIVLPGISVATVQNIAYVQTGQGGRLSFQAAGTNVALNFVGQYQLSDFALTAGPQPFSNSAPSLIIAPSTYVVTNSASALLTLAAGSGFGAAAGIRLAGTPNVVTADQATTLLALKDFAFEPGATMDVVDTAVSILAYLPACARATSVKLYGGNTLTAAQAAMLATLPGFALSAGATLTIADTVANLAASLAGLAFASAITPLGLPGTTSIPGLTSALAGALYIIAPSQPGLIDTLTVPATVMGGPTNNQIVVAAAGGLAFNAGLGSGTVIAGGGNNLISIYPGAGTQNIVTGAGNDTVAMLAGANTVSAGGGTNLILAQGGNHLIWSAGNDLISIPDGNSTVSAGSNAPTIFLGSGRSLVDAGMGRATVVVGGSAATINSAGAGQFWMQAGGGVVNSQGADTIIGGTGASTINMPTASDFIFAGPGPININAGGGVSTILGSSAGSTSITGGAGSVIAVAYGATHFTGGAGAATIAAFGGGATVLGGTGSGVYLGGPAGGNRITGGTGRETMIGGGPGDVLTAGPNGGDALQAGPGAATLSALGGTGRNNFYGGSGPNLMILGDGGDQVLAGTGRETLVGGSGQDLYAFLSGNHPDVIIQNFQLGQDYISLLGFAPTEAAAVIAGAVIVAGSTQISLSDGTTISFTGVTGLSRANIL